MSDVFQQMKEILDFSKTFPKLNEETIIKGIRHKENKDLVIDSLEEAVKNGYNLADFEIYEIRNSPAREIFDRLGTVVWNEQVEIVEAFTTLCVKLNQDKIFENLNSNLNQKITKAKKGKGSYKLEDLENEKYALYERFGKEYKPRTKGK